MTRHLRAEGSRRVAALQTFRLLRQRFREGSRRVGRSGWRTWRRLAGAGFAALLLAMTALRYVAEWLLQHGALAWETAFLDRIAGTLRFSSAVFFQAIGSDIPLILLVVGTSAAAVAMLRPITALSIVLAFAGADLVVRYGWLIWDRARPDVLYEGFASPGFHSFPSGHTAKTTAVYGVLAFVWMRASRSAAERTAAALLLLALVTLTGMGRMAMGVHWPSDIAGGFLIGLLWLCVLARGMAREPAAPVSSSADSPGA